MWIQVRSMDGRKIVRLDNLSKLSKIEEVRDRLVDEFDADPSRQRLFYRGKQLEDGHSLFDYDVGLNDIIQIFVRPPQAVLSNGHDSEQSTTVTNGHQSITNGHTSNGHVSLETSTNGDEVETMEIENGDNDEDKEEITSLYKIGEKVDAKDLRMGAWFEAQVTKIVKQETIPDTDNPSSSQQFNLCYHVKFDDYDDEVSELLERDIRPRAGYRMQWEQLSIGQTVMVNYNPDHPRQRGFWYDATITRKVDDPKKLYCKLMLGSVDQEASEECLIKFVDEIFRIETKECPDQQVDEGETRMKKPDCDHCKDNPSRRCKHCACSQCGGKNDPDKQILCDECDMAFHLWCLTPPLGEVPESDEWYCHECKTDTSEVIGAGEKLKLTKKKASMQSKKRNCGRDWGKGMACVGRTKICTIVPSNHFGPIPGVPVGTMWKFRVQVSESGVHRPHVAGIHGRENEGSYSIVLSGGYEDDKDDGEEFVYSGSGGRDLSGNKRTAKQSMDQKLTAMNRALAKNCNAVIDDKNGATAKDWRKGKPVRVIRNHKGSKTSKYCPKEGNRYDGIYKIVKYWPHRNKEDLLVWKYLLRRDDTAPAPWTSEGKKMTKKLGLAMQYPDGYLEAQKGASNGSHDSDEEVRTSKKGGRKRKSVAEDSSPLKSKQPRYELTKQQKELIKSDICNSKMWEEVMQFAESAGSAGLLSKIEELFTCIVCQEVVYQPISTPCSHNVCKSCLSRSFKAEVDTCPNCRFKLDKENIMEVNKPLQRVLLDLFPGYEGGR